MNLNSPDQPINVTCAIIIDKNRILAAQRGKHMDRSGLWEFPGGKVEANESYSACIHREIKEELNISIEIIQPLTPVVHHYKDRSIKLIPYVAKLKGGFPVAKEHENIKWFKLETLLQLNWAAADVAIVKELISAYNDIEL